MKNIAIYNRILEYGGVSEVSIKLYEGLKDYGFNVELVSIEDRRDYLEGTVINVKGLINEVIKLVKFIRENKKNIIIINPSIHVLFIKLYSILTLKKINLIIIVHMRPKFWLLDKTINNKITNFIIRIGIKVSEKVIAVSNDLANELVTEKIVERSKVRTIYNPIVVKKIEKHRYKDIECKEYIDIVIVGWITKLKGQIRVIESLKLINDSRYRLNIIGGIGDSGYYKELVNKINKYNLQDQIKFWGEVDDVRSILDTMDVYVLASESEALPTVLIEALECGIPIIASNCKWGPKEILMSGTYGELYDLDNYEELAIKIQNICNNISYNNLREKSYIRANDFNKDISINKYKKLINDLRE